MHRNFRITRAFLIPVALLPFSVLAPAGAAVAAARAQRPAPAGESSYWPGFHHGPDGDGYNAFEHVLGPNDVRALKQEWAVNPAEAGSSPVVAGSRIFDSFSRFGPDGTEISDLVAVDRATGQRQWTARLDSAGRAESVSAGRVFVSTVAGVTAYRATSGARLWQRAVGFTREPTVSGGAVYVGSAKGYVAALAADTGRMRWQTTLPGSVDSTVAVEYGMVFAVAADSNLYALSAVTGKIVWHQHVGHVYGGGPAVQNGVVYLAADTQSDSDGILVALRASTGKRLWQRAAGDDVHSVPAVDGHVVTVGAIDGDVFAFSPATGRPLWVRRVDGEVWSSIALANGLAFLTTDTSRAYALDTSNGKTLWTDMPQPCCTFATTASIAETHQTVYVGYGDAGLRAYTLPANPPG